MENIIAGHDTLALLPTGGGKSLCYQVPAMMMDGFALVVSPLVALMEDQVARLKSIGIPATSIHAGMKWHAVKQLLEEVLLGHYKLLYVSPERLQSQLFQEYLPAMPISLIAVDEAHCVSQWGHDFRPEYLQVSGIRADHPKVPVLALTASATPIVQDDIITQLKLRQVSIYRQSFDRPNIQYKVRYSEGKENHILEALKNTAGSAIVYCRSRRNTETISRLLQQHGMSAQPYHAGMARERREQIQLAWMKDEVRIVAATTAFGMGIDKPDVQLVIHYDAPDQLEAYYQEAGRAGRDGKDATALTFYNYTDVKRLLESISLQYPPVDYLRLVYQSVNEYLQIPIGAEPQQYFPFELTDFCKKFRLELLPATYALRLLAREGLWTISDAVFQPATVQFIADRHAIDNLNVRYPALGAVATAMLRLYNGIYQFPVTVRPFALAKKLRSKKDDVDQALLQLHHTGIINYQPATDGPQLFFHHYRVDSRHLNINTERILRLKKQQEMRIGSMIRFLEEKTTCRSKIMLNYFGEDAPDHCGHCDICLQRQSVKNWNEKEMHATVINYLSQTADISVQELTSQFPDANPVLLHALIRRMVDDGRINWREDNIINLKKRS